VKLRSYENNNKERSPLKSNGAVQKIFNFNMPVNRYQSLAIISVFKKVVWLLHEKSQVGSQTKSVMYTRSGT